MVFPEFGSQSPAQPLIWIRATVNCPLLCGREESYFYWHSLQRLLLTLGVSPYRWSLLTSRPRSESIPSDRMDVIQVAPARWLDVLHRDCNSVERDITSFHRMEARRIELLFSLRKSDTLPVRHAPVTGSFTDVCQASNLRTPYNGGIEPPRGVCVSCVLSLTSIQNDG